MIGPSRDWTEARLKIDREGRCRHCSQRAEDGVKLDAAHTVGRSYDPHKRCSVCRGSGIKANGRDVCGSCKGAGETSIRFVHPKSVIPLCSDCHRAQHRNEIELLPLMNAAEQAWAVSAVGGIMAALQRLTIGNIS